MRKRWGARFIPPLSTGRSIAQEGARWCRVPNTRKVAKRRGRHSKRLPEIVPEQVAAQADATGQQRPAFVACLRMKLVWGAAVTRGDAGLPCACGPQWRFKWGGNTSTP